jgi:hypothetical protein
VQSGYSSQLQEIFAVQSKIVDIHPLLARVFPIALVEDGQFLIFDAEPSDRRFVFIKQAATPMPMPRGVLAAFPLESYGNRVVCVVTGEVFDSLEGYVTIFHEFIHCQQFEICELELKQRLGIARKAQAEGDQMWEINYPFPYDAARFVELYTSFLRAVEGDRPDKVLECRRQLKQGLDAGDFEYMVWQEWKEGFARFVENRIRRRLGLEENHGGREEPFERVLFYEGGARFIEFLEAREPHLTADIEKLFGRMLQ